MRSFRQAGTPGAGVSWSGLACMVGLAFGFPVAAQSVRASWVERVPVTAEVVPMPARFGPLMATLIEATAPSPFGTVSIGRTENAPAPSAGTAPVTGSIAVSVVPLTETAPASTPPPGQTVPATDRLDLPPLMEPTGTHGVVQSYLVAAAGSAALAAAPAAQAGAVAPARAIIRVHDGHSGRSVVMASREGVGDGRLVITVVFN